MEDVLVHKQTIPFTRFCGGVGRTAQENNRHSNGQGCWPAKSAKFFLDLPKNAKSKRVGCGFSSHFTHPGKPSTETEASHISCSWKNQPCYQLNLDGHKNVEVGELCEN